MDTLQRNESREDKLNESTDSWVQLNDDSSLGSSLAGTEGASFHRGAQSVLSSQMEKLLLEAQRENSRSSSQQGSLNSSSRGSPKSPHSPNNEFAAEGVPVTIQEGQVLQNLQASDWIWDWSSRPEALPPSDMTLRFKHPVKPKLSVRNTKVMRSGPFCMENLPTLLLSHACTFIMGAAVMFIYLKKYLRWSVIAIETSD